MDILNQEATISWLDDIDRKRQQDAEQEEQAKAQGRIAAENRFAELRAGIEDDLRDFAPRLFHSPVLAGSLAGRDEVLLHSAS